MCLMLREFGAVALIFVEVADQHGQMQREEYWPVLCVVWSALGFGELEQERLFGLLPSYVEIDLDAEPAFDVDWNKVVLGG